VTPERILRFWEYRSANSQNRRKQSENLILVIRASYGRLEIGDIACWFLCARPIRLLIGPAPILVLVTSSRRKIATAVGICSRGKAPDRRSRLGRRAMGRMRQLAGNQNATRLNFLCRKDFQSKVRWTGHFR